MRLPGQLTDWPTAVVDGDQLDTGKQIVPELVDIIRLGIAAGDAAYNNILAHGPGALRKTLVIGARLRRHLRNSTRRLNPLLN